MTKNSCLTELQLRNHSRNTGLTVSDGEISVLPAGLQCKGGACTLAETGFLIKLLSTSVMSNSSEVQRAH